MKAQAVAESFATSISILQPMYSLVKRQAEVEMLPMALSEGFAVASYSPLGGGLLTGKYAGGDGGRLVDDTMYKARYGVDWMHQAAQDLSALAKDCLLVPLDAAAKQRGLDSASWLEATKQHQVQNTTDCT